MLLNDVKATSGEIIIDGNNISETVSHRRWKDCLSFSAVKGGKVEVGFCPQFDWLVNDLSVGETLLLFAR